ncbi:MAG: hypothetical protein WBW61_04125, partial [Rhodanobacteraceae bacterium]
MNQRRGGRAVQGTGLDCGGRDAGANIGAADGPKGEGQDALSQTGVVARAARHGVRHANNGEVAERFKAPVLT